MYINIANTCAILIDNHIPDDLQYALKDEFRHHWEEKEQVTLPIVGRVDYDVSLNKPSSAVMLLDKRLFVDSDNHYVCEGSGVYRVALTEECFHITTNSDAASDVVTVLIQSLLNFYITQYALVFLHTAAFKYKDKVYAIHGFGGAGKTETMIEALSRGAMFISDDLAIFNEQGQIFPYLRKISLHDYPYTDEQLVKYGLSRRLYHMMQFCHQHSNRVTKYLYRRWSGYFKISLDYTKLTCGQVSALHFYDVNYNYWLDASNNTTYTSLSKEVFNRKMSFCMDNEFRPYIDFDGYLGITCPFWQKIRERHQIIIKKVLSVLDVQGISINKRNYTELTDLILKKK